MNKPELYDCTLRDGTQNRDVNLTMYDKLKIVKALDDFGIDYIELGWPGSNPKDMESFLEASKLKLNHSKISAFGSTQKKGLKPEQDPNLKAIIDSKAKVCSIFGKSIKAHVELQLKITPEENLELIFMSVKYLTANGIKVFYDAEHFFDGFKDDNEYALSCLLHASNAGAECLVLCDTNGGCLPDEVKSIINEVCVHLKKKKISTPLGVHMHNDSGCAVANSLIALDSISQIQGTINGFGERCGNADLIQIIPNLAIKKQIKLPNIELKKLSELSNFVYTLANIKPNSNQPYVGRNAFAHKGGVHVDAVSKGASYEHIDPALVGNKRDIVLSDLSGKANIVEMAKKFKINLEKNSEGVKEALSEVERLEMLGYSIGELEAEQYLIVKKFIEKKPEPLTIKTWKIMSEFRKGEFAECILTGQIMGKDREIVAPLEGSGPVGATYHALQKFIATVNKDIFNVKLMNYKVRIAQDKGPDSSVRVYIEFKSNGDEWGCVGVSTNILEASVEAIKKGFIYFLYKKGF